MLKTEIIEELANATGMSKAKAGEVFTTFENAIFAGLEKDGRVSLGNIGILKTVYRSARTARNPQTGEEIQIAEKVAVAFKPSKALAEKINTKENINKIKK